MTDKGQKFEREVCVKLSLWVTHWSAAGPRRDVFWRSAMSGGRATVAFGRGIKLDRHAGDIVAISPEGFALTDRYFVEIKFRRDYGLESFLLFNKGPLRTWWTKTLREAAKYGKQPIMIVKSNRRPALVVTECINHMNMYPVIRNKYAVIGLFGTMLKTRCHINEPFIARRKAGQSG